MGDNYLRQQNGNDIHPFYYLEPISEAELITELREASPLAIDQTYPSDTLCEVIDEQMLREITSLNGLENSYCASIPDTSWSHSNSEQNNPIVSTNSQMNFNVVDIIENQVHLQTENRQEGDEERVTFVCNNNTSTLDLSSLNSSHFNAFHLNIVTQSTITNDNVIVNSLIPTHVEDLEAEEEKASSFGAKSNKLITRRGSKRCFKEISNGVKQKSVRQSSCSSVFQSVVDTGIQDEQLLLSPSNIYSSSKVDSSLKLGLASLVPQQTFNSYQSSGIGFSNVFVSNSEQTLEDFVFQHEHASMEASCQHDHVSAEDEATYQQRHASVEEGSCSQSINASVADDSFYQHDHVSSSVNTSEISRCTSERENRRRIQNRKAAKRFRLKKKTMEEKLNESMESLMSEKEFLKSDIGNLVQTAHQLQADLNRHLNNNCSLSRTPEVS